MAKYLYLFIDVFSLSIPLASSFLKRAPFYKQWKYFWPANLIVTAFFLVWDITFTKMGIWGFNPDYVCGIYLYNLPIEEVLFFICIPYACVFTYYALNHLFEKDYLFPHQEIISSLLILVLLVSGMYFMDKAYTATTFLLLAFLLAYQMIKLKPRYMGRFYFAFLFILIPFFLVNGVLTGSYIDEAIVWYNNDENLGFRMGTIPFEDTFYGMLLILLNIGLMEWLEERERFKRIMK